MRLLTTLLNLASQVPDSLPRRRVTLIPLPLVYHTPETRLAYGEAFKDDLHWCMTK